MIASDITYWTKAINGKNIKCQLIPHPPSNTKRRIITHDIKKLIKPLVTMDIGSISRGK